MSLRARGATVRRGTFTLVADFETPLAGVTVVFGPSGAGKSMLLATLAGLNRLESGDLALDDRVIEDAMARTRTPPHLRDIGVVFQDARLFPHLSVRGNMDYAVKRAPADRAGPGLEETARQLEIGDLLDRRVRNLSGGERSRVALARTLLSRPSLLLLDEPFAALDGRRRRAFLALLARVNAETGLPMIVVTHQIDDAAELADHVLAMRDGRIVAMGAASEAMSRPEFLSLLDTRDLGARIAARDISGGDTLARGVWVRADAVMAAAERPHGLSARNVWEGRVASVVREDDGARVLWIATRAGEIPARITQAAFEELGLTAGKPAWAVVKTHAL
ncbi:MAG: ATP-binding cassette domain-containing protein [Alphaproteobacteria bacterium]|nr:ATP-binding cassette domain-containing protein [Alphaproteobacteria bacterium]